jgi:hypothetical protein
MSYIPKNGITKSSILEHDTMSWNYGILKKIEKP